MKRSRPEDMAGHDPSGQPLQKRTTYRAVPVHEQAPYRQLKVEDALAYLDRVKKQFGEQPYIYNQFLEIMKNFKAQTIDTPGVIKRVSELFKGHNSLILGFNTFLPPGYKIEVVTETIPQVAPAAAPIARATARAAAVQPQPRREGQPLEFDHAISYVTKIKRRFVNDPNTYKAFLDILHTYQKQQRSIKDVLEKVSHLFRDHADLLQDFTYFLPDAVQPEVEQILRHNKVAGITARSKRGRRSKAEPVSEMRDDRDKRSRRPRRDSRKVRNDPLIGSLPPSERTFFQKIKSQLGSRERWQEFLKCLQLYAREVVTKAELLTLSADIFGSKNSALYEDFKMVLNMRGMIESHNDDVWYSLPVSEINFTQCRQCTPSYRALPDSYPMFTCSERTPEDQSVLNDRWVSVPTGSEDFSFKSMRKNQYEEALFKCEDERYEVDMVIENNAAAIRALEPLANEISTLQSTEPTVWQFRLDSRSLGVLHLKAIARIYGDHGAEMLELLRRNPAGAIPVILKRLKEKDAEWKKVKVTLNKKWKEVLENNYQKSLDHRSFYFKQADKRAVTSKFMLSAIKTEAEADATAAFHIVMEHPDTSVHADAANTIAYAIEKSSSADKEGLAGLWSSFVEQFLRFPASWALQGKAGAGTAAFRVGVKVTTPYGLGRIKAVRRVDPYSRGVSYQVELAWGIAIVTADSLKLFTEQPAEEDSDSLCTPGSSLFYGTANAYYFFRLYSMIVQRFAVAKKLAKRKQPRAKVSHPADKLAAEAEAEGKGEDEDVDMTGGDSDDLPSAATAGSTSEQLYKYFLTALYSVLDGSRDSSKFEDECRTLMGTASYQLFTLEKVVTSAVKQLGLMAAENASLQFRERFAQQQINQRTGTGESLQYAHELAYRKAAAALSESTGAEVFCVRYTVGPVTGDRQQSGQVHMSYLGSATPEGGFENEAACPVAPPSTSTPAAAAAGAGAANANATAGAAAKAAPAAVTPVVPVTLPVGM